MNDYNAGYLDGYEDAINSLEMKILKLIKNEFEIIKELRNNDTNKEANNG